MNDFDEIKQRVTIRDILLDAGYNPKRNRMRCPIHGGKNPTSFSFDNDWFKCFACGASGGLIDLVRYLHNHTKPDAIRHLCQLAGVPYREIESGNANETGTPRAQLSLPKRKPPRRSAELEKLRTEQEIVETLLWAYTRIIQMWHKALNRGEISLADYYAKIKIFESDLEELDEQAAQLNHKIHCLENRFKVKRNKTNEDIPAHY